VATSVLQKLIVCLQEQKKLTDECIVNILNAPKGQKMSEEQSERCNVSPPKSSFLKKLLGWFLQSCDIVIEKGKLVFKIVGIGRTSVSHIQSPNAHHYMTEKESYHQYLAEQ
jgi:hypothetical protein